MKPRLTIRLDLEGEDTHNFARALCAEGEQLTANKLFVFAAERLLIKAREEKDAVRLFDGYGFHLSFDVRLEENHNHDCQKGIPGCKCKVGWPPDEQCPNCRDDQTRDSYCECPPKAGV